MSMYRKIARALAALAAAALLGAAAAAAQPLAGSDDGTRWRPGLTIHRSLGSETETFRVCRTVGTPTSVARSLCYRAAVSLANEPQIQSPPPRRPVVNDGTAFDWEDAGLGFAVAVGLGLVGAGAVMSVRSWRVKTRLH